MRKGLTLQGENGMWGRRDLQGMAVGWRVEGKAGFQCGGEERWMLFRFRFVSFGSLAIINLSICEQGLIQIQPNVTIEPYCSGLDVTRPRRTLRIRVICGNRNMTKHFARQGR